MGLKHLPPPWYILLYTFLITQTNFTKIDFLSKFKLVFAVSALDNNVTTRWYLFFLYVFCWKNECILEDISNTSHYRWVLSTYFIIYGEFDLFIHKLQWPCWNMMTSSKTTRDFDYYFGAFWEILCTTTLMQSLIARA